MIAFWYAFLVCLGLGLVAGVPGFGRMFGSMVLFLLALRALGITT